MVLMVVNAKLSVYARFVYIPQGINKTQFFKVNSYSILVLVFTC